MLYEMCCDTNFDMERLEYMLDMMKKVDTGNMSYHDASVDVGQKLFDHYVASVVDVEKLKRKDI